MSAVTKIQDTNLICAAGISQYGALGALQAGIGFCKDKIEAIAQVRHLALKELDALSDICTIPAAKGAFYFLIKVHSDRDAFEITKQLIEQHKVAVIPGDTFGMTGCYLRVAYGALDFDTVAEGMGRLVTGLRAIV
jgi:aspartate/methionine/tyrosine aminotransferase